MDALQPTSTQYHPLNPELERKKKECRQQTAIVLAVIAVVSIIGIPIVAKYGAMPILTPQSKIVNGTREEVNQEMTGPQTIGLVFIIIAGLTLFFAMRSICHQSCRVYNSSYKGGCDPDKNWCKTSGYNPAL